MRRYKLLKNENGGCGVIAEGDGSCRYFADITTDEAAMRELVALCNREQLSLCHFEDVVEDFLTDFCI